MFTSTAKTALAVLAVTAGVAGCSSSTSEEAAVDIPDEVVVDVESPVSVCRELAEAVPSFLERERHAFDLAVEHGPTTEVRQWRYGNAFSRASLVQDSAGCEVDATFECAPLPVAFDEFTGMVITIGLDDGTVDQATFDAAAVNLDAAALTCLNAAP